MDEKSSDESHKEVTTQVGKLRATCAEQRNTRNSAKDHAPQERRGTLNRRQPRDKNKQTHSPFCVVLKTYQSSTCSHKLVLETL